MARFTRSCRPVKTAPRAPAGRDLHSVGANATHGLRRSNADKRRAVVLLLEDEEWSSGQTRRSPGNAPFITSCRAPAATRLHCISGYSEARSPGLIRTATATSRRCETSSIGRKPVEAPTVPTRPMMLSSSLRSLDGRRPHAPLHDSPSGACRPHLHSGCRSGPPAANPRHRVARRRVPRSRRLRGERRRRPRWRRPTRNARRSRRPGTRR